MCVKRALSSCGVLGAFALLALASPASGQALRESTDFLSSIAFVDDRLAPEGANEPIDDLQGAVAPAVRDGWASFRTATGGEWVGYVDRRTGYLDSAEGSGLAWVPGAGNRLTAVRQVDLATVESIVRGFLPRVAGAMGVDPSELVLHTGRSGQPADHLWYVDFDVVRGGLRVEGARVFFGVNHGNLVQFGTENLPALGEKVPAQTVSSDRAMAILADFIGGVQLDDRFLDNGSLHLRTVAPRGQEQAATVGLGGGRELALYWELSFQRPDVVGTWRTRIDASSGEMLEFLDANHYGQVTGGVYLSHPAGGETVQAFPFADVGGGVFSDTAGNYPGSGTASTLNGTFVRVLDSCGTISEPSSGGNISFGTSTGTNCTTPGHGGAGNTHSSRSQFYHLNRIKEVGRSWLPGNAWLNAKLTANVNLNQTCNAYWNGSTVNFFRSGGGCGNTGEIAAISLHEYGHGLDSNDGNSSQSDLGSGETYGDFTAAVQLENSCIGPGFLGSNCGGYGDACTSCTGVRDIDWAKHVSNTPHTVANFTQPRCPTSATYRGPCGREGHCESYVSSEALWDLANRDLPSPGSASAWATAERLWYQTRPTQTKMFNCTASGTWSANGCFTGSLFRTFRLADDDDGNLANGTPNGCHIYAALNRHGIACTTDAAASTCSTPCTPPAAPTGLSATAAGQTQINLSWSAVSGASSYNVYRSTTSGGPYTLVGSSATTSFSNTGLTCNTTYFYVVRAVSGGCESGNSNQASATTAACSACTTSTLYSHNFDTGSGLVGWTRGSFGGSGTTVTWRGVQTCSPAQSGSRIFRYGGTSCTANYTSNNFNFAQPNGAGGIAVPAGSTTTRLSFWHRRRYESGFDGGTLTVSLDGSNYTFVPASAILSGTTYNGTVAPDCAPAGSAGTSIFTGISSTMTNTVVNLDAACVAAGAAGGCAGQAVRIGFTSITDCSVVDDGWFLDTVAVTACTP